MELQICFQTAREDKEEEMLFELLWSLGERKGNMRPQMW